MKKIIACLLFVVSLGCFAFEKGEWKAVFDPAFTEKDVASVSLNGLPADKGVKVTPSEERNMIYLGKYSGKFTPLKGRAIVYRTIESDCDKVVPIRINCYWYWICYLNGKKISDNVPPAGTNPPNGEFDYKIELPLKKGTNRIAVLVNSGYGTFQFFFAQLPDISFWPENLVERQKVYDLLFLKPTALVRPPWVFNHDVDSVRIGAEFNNASVCSLRLYPKGKKEKVRTIQNVSYGILRKNTTHLFNIGDLVPDTEYCFELVRLDEVSGDSLIEYCGSFKTHPDKGIEQTFVAFSDTQVSAKARIQAVDDVFKNCGGKEADMIVSLGDTDQTYDVFKETFFETYYDHMVKNKKDVVHYMTRGNHEYRGKEAGRYSEYLGRSYYSFRRGDVYYIVLDVGEDKPRNPERLHAYTWHIDTDKYFDEQAEWLEKVVNSEECRNAKYRIVFAHSTPFEFEDAYMNKNNYRFYKFFFGENPACKIDLWLCAHTHCPYRYDPVSRELYGAKSVTGAKWRKLNANDLKKVRFPVYVNDGPGGTGENLSVSIVSVGKDGLNVKCVTPKGKVIDHVTMPKNGKFKVHETTYVKF